MTTKKGVMPDAAERGPHVSAQHNPIENAGDMSHPSQNTLSPFLHTIPVSEELRYVQIKVAGDNVLKDVFLRPRRTKRTQSRLP